MREGAEPCPLTVTGNGHGRVTEPENDHFSGPNLGIISDVSCSRSLRGALDLCYAFAGFLVGFLLLEDLSSLLQIKKRVVENYKKPKTQYN